MAVIGSLTVKLGLVTVEWDKATAQAKAQAKDLQSALRGLGVDMTNIQNLFRTLGGAAGLSVAGIAAMSHAVMQLAGDVSDLSDATGVSAGRILQFQKALIMAGGKAEDAKTIISTLFNKIAAAQDGNDTAIAQFEQLGISFAELKRLSPDEAIKRVYEGLSQLGNSFERVRVTRELLGKAGVGKSIDEIAEALGRSTAEFDKQARALKEWDKMGDALTETLLNLKLAIAELLAPFTSDATISANQFKAAILAITSAAVVGGMFRLVAAFKALNTALKSTASLGLAISAAGGIKGIAMAGAALATYFGAMKAFETQDEEAAAQPPAEGMGGNEPMGGKPGGNQAEQARARIALMREMMDIDRRRSEYQIGWMNRSQDELKLAESRLKYEEDLARIKSETTQALSKENLTKEQIALVMEERNLRLRKARQDYDARDALINANRDKAIKLYEQETEFIKQRNSLTERGLELENNRRYMTEFEFESAKENLALEQKLLQIEQDRERLRATRDDTLSPEFVNEMARLNNAEAAAKREAQIRLERIKLNERETKDWSAGWEKAMREFAQNADNFGKAGEAAFNSVVGNMMSAIDTFIRTGKFSFKDFARSVIQDLLRIQMQAQATFLLQKAFQFFEFGGKAGGGDVSQSIPYMVGENGPELFIPKTGGTIIPNARLGSAGGMGGETYVTNNYINAIDVKSFEERIMASPNAVWAANKYADKSLQIGRGRT